jgi:hypothetical protein
LLHGLKTGNLRHAVHACRVLTAGSWYLLTGHQPRNVVVGRETFQTESLLRRELNRLGLVLRSEQMPDSTAETPSFIVYRPLTR